MKLITTKEAPAAIGPYSQAVLVNDTLYTSGQLGLEPETGLFATNEIIGQTKQVFKNIDAVLKAAGFKKEDVCKVTVYLKNMSVFSEVNHLYGQFFGEHKPARSTVEVARLPKDGLIEIDLIAHKS